MRAWLSRPDGSRRSSGRVPTREQLQRAAALWGLGAVLWWLYAVLPSAPGGVLAMRFLAGCLFAFLAWRFYKGSRSAHPGGSQPSGHHADE